MDLRTRATSIAARLFGQPAMTPVGPARLALRTGAPVVVCTVERQPETGVLAVTCTRIATADLSDESVLTALINAELERRIRTAPDLWLWMHDRFESKML
jgi:KDO2-lipid IV(A) lauroyltransferase